MIPTLVIVLKLDRHSPLLRSTSVIAQTATPTMTATPTATQTVTTAQTPIFEVLRQPKISEFRRHLTVSIRSSHTSNKLAEGVGFSPTTAPIGEF
jgi:hypothetical protein